MGGYDTNWNPTASVEAYSPANDTWAPAASLPTTGNDGIVAATGPDGRIYAAGGGQDTPTSAMNVYGPVTSLLPATGNPGTSVTVTGTNFAASAG